MLELKSGSEPILKVENLEEIGEIKISPSSEMIPTNFLMA